MESTLKDGAKVADIGCGHGSSTLLMAQTYPGSTVYGYDFHPPSIAAAKAKASEAGVSNIEFQVVSAKEKPKPKSMMLSPAWPNAGPTGGAGVA